MNRDRAIAIGLFAFILFWIVPSDNMTAFACGGFAGLVLGAVLGAAFVYGEWEEKTKVGES